MKSETIDKICEILDVFIGLIIMITFICILIEVEELHEDYKCVTIKTENYYSTHNCKRFER